MTNAYAQNQLQIDYLAPSFHQFQEDFYQYAKTAIPLIFLVDDLLLSMAKRQQPYFILQANKSTDSQKHVFNFDVRHPKENPLIAIYRYCGHEVLKS